VPIYSGTISVDCDFNEQAFLNYQNTKDMEHFVKRVKQLDEDEVLYETFYEQPLLLEEPSLNEALAFVYNAVKEMK
jgi:hypothetical protein